jgi:hypothetical protein
MHQVLFLRLHPQALMVPPPEQLVMVLAEDPVMREQLVLLVALVALAPQLTVEESPDKTLQQLPIHIFNLVWLRS